MKNFISNLNDREKWMVIIAVLCTFFYSYYLFLYAPLRHTVTQKSAQLAEKTKTLAWMKQARQQTHTTPKKQSIDNSQLLTLLSNQLKNSSLTSFSYQLQQTGSGDIQLSFEAVPFTLFITWLAKINARYTFTVNQFNVESTSNSGITKLTINIGTR